MQHRFRHIAQLGIILFLFPLFAQAECSSSGYTVVFVNGIFNTEKQARTSADELQFKLGETFNSESVIVRTGYNPSHLAGLGDLAQVVAQSFGASVSTFDRDTILLQIHPEVTTRKVFLIGHSQGTLYTNNIYDYLLDNGEPKKSVGVYNIATPANYVAGGGAYLTSKTDFIIQAYEEYARKAGALAPLPSNAQLDFGAAVGNGHSFTDIYLTYAGERIVGDIQHGLARLTAEEGTATEGCFTPPDGGLGYKTKQALYAVADPAAIGLKVAAVTGFKGAAVAVGGVKSGLAAVGSFFASGAAAVTPKPRTENLPGSFNIVKKIYGSSVSEEDLKDLLGENKSAAVAAAVDTPKKSPPLATEPQSQSVSELPPEEVSEEVAVVKTQQEEETQQPSTPLIPPLYSVGGSPGFGGGGTSAPVATPTALAPVVPVATSSTPTASSTPVTPTVVSVSSDGKTYSSFTPSPVTIIIIFNTQMASSSVAVEGVSQTVGDCADADAKTFCIGYVIPAIEPAVFRILTLGGESTDGEVMSTDTSHMFIVDSLGPVVSVDALTTKLALPTLTGATTDSGQPIEVSFNGAYYTLTPSAGFWSLVLVPGEELAEGSYTATASSTDAVDNPGAATTGTVVVDLTAPVISITSGPAEGGSIASSTPASFGFTVVDTLSTTVVCAFDADLLLPCTSPFSSTLSSGAHSFIINASDAANNIVGVTRTFTVLP